MPAAIGATAITWIARDLTGRFIVDRGDREQFFVRATLTQGDDESDLNRPMVHQYHPELNTALQPTWPP